MNDPWGVAETVYVPSQEFAQKIKLPDWFLAQHGSNIKSWQMESHHQFPFCEGNSFLLKHKQREHGKFCLIWYLISIGQTFDLKCPETASKVKIAITISNLQRIRWYKNIMSRHPRSGCSCVWRGLDIYERKNYTIKPCQIPWYHQANILKNKVFK